MSETFRGPRAWVTAALGTSAAVGLAYKLTLGLDAADADAFESSLAMSIARELTDGPGILYGPYGAKNPLVLIHAPFYYRLAGLAAWPLARAGLDPLWAAIAAGRSVSAVATLATLYFISRLARLDGAPRQTGWWAALIFAGSPVLGGFPVAVRPDLLGVCLQTAGVYWILSTLRGGTGRAGVTAAFVAFGLAFCVKQHDVGAAAVSLGILLAAWVRGRVGSVRIDRAVLSGAAVVAAVYGVEHVLTGGHVWESAFVAASAVGKVHPAAVSNALIVVASVVNRLVSPLVVLVAAGLVLLRSRPGFVRLAAWALGTLLIAAALFFLLSMFLAQRPEYGALLMTLEAVLLPTLVVCLPKLLPRDDPGTGLDVALWAYVLVEAVLTVVLCFGSTGAWVNYAIQLAAFASVLAARAIARAVHAFDPGPGSAPTSRSAFLPLALALAIVAAASIYEAYDSYRTRRRDQGSLVRASERLGRGPGEFFIVDKPGANRLWGRRGLVYDQWLYPVFETLRLAEPRSGWLLRALTDGTIDVVVTSSESPDVEGIPTPLSGLGYRRALHVGRFYFWQRNVTTINPATTTRSGN